MKYGMNLLLWTGDMHEGMLPVLESLKEMGYDGVELPLFDMDIDKWTKWNGWLDDLGLACTAVTVRGEEPRLAQQPPAVIRGERSQLPPFVSRGLDPVEGRQLGVDPAVVGQQQVRAKQRVSLAWQQAGGTGLAPGCQAPPRLSWPRRRGQRPLWRKSGR